MTIFKALFLLCLISITPSLASASMLEMAEELWEKQASSAADRPSPVVSPIQTPPDLDPANAPAHMAFREYAKNLLSTITGANPLNPKLPTNADIDSLLTPDYRGIIELNTLLSRTAPKTPCGPFTSSVPLAVHRINRNLPQGDIAPLPDQTSLKVIGNGGFLVINRTDDHDPLQHYKRVGTVRSFDSRDDK